MVVLDTFGPNYRERHFDTFYSFLLKLAERGHFVPKAYQSITGIAMRKSPKLMQKIKKHPSVAMRSEKNKMLALGRPRSRKNCGKQRIVPGATSTAIAKATEI